MPKREGVDALGLPFFPSSRSRPGSSSTANRPGTYTLGTNISNSSSSLVLGRNVAATASEPNLAAQALSGPVPAVDAPHLSTTEAFFGRVTLTAPDNMRRKKAEEKERKRQARKKRAERGAAAAATLVHPSEIAVGSSSQHHLTPLLQGLSPPDGDEIVSRRQRNKRPALPTSNSTSNLHLHTLEHSRSRSPTRPARPHSAQTNHFFLQQQQRETTTPRQLRRRRSGNDGDSNSLASQSPNVAAAPVYVNAETSQQGRISSSRQPSDNQSVPSTAAQRRRDIYADLESLGLPGANESDLEDQPPPFPPYANRPISPPRLPAEGEEWTEEMRRRQEEYEMHRPPDSPPPAFRSEDEIHARSEESEVSLSDEESISEAVASIRKEWEDDILAGYTLEERIARDQNRKLQRNGTDEPEGSKSKGQLRAEFSSSAMEVLREERSTVTEGESSSPALNLGKLVVEARARRVKVMQHDKDPLNTCSAPSSSTADYEQSLPPSRAALPLITAVAADEDNDNSATRSEQEIRVPSETIRVQPNPGVVTHQRNIRSNRKTRTVADSANAKKRKAGNAADKQTAIHTSQATTPGQIPSRFRDGASAAAARRMALWGNSPETQSERLYLHGEVRAPSASLARSEGDLPALLNTRQEAEMILAEAPVLHRREFSSSDVASGHGVEGDVDSSSDSDEAWNKEEAAFEAIQRRLAGPALQVDSSDEDDEPVRRSNMPRSNSIDLARPGSNVPKAPPPLVLGRSRGGMDDYSSSSSSSSDSAGRRLDDDSDDDSLSPPGEDDGGGHLETFPSATIDKGKKPMRATSLELSQSLSTPFVSPNLGRAGKFEKDSASSHDLATDDDNDQQPTLSSIKKGQENSESNGRLAVRNRLKDLFATSLAPETQQQSRSALISATSRASADILLDPRSSVKTSSIGNGENLDQTSNRMERRSSNESLRSKERANAYASLESRTSGYSAEHQARLEALEDISRLQRANAEDPASSTGINQSSLDALERLLSRTSPHIAQNSSFNNHLSRSGAINRREMPAPFVNPRSSIAPKPLGRLPTITSDTRHFPPSLNSTIPSTDRRKEAAIAGGLANPNESGPRRNGVGTPSWMAYIPSNERRALPEPLKPTAVSERKNSSVSMGDTSDRAPPPLPLRRNRSKVLAMVERFESQSPSTSDSVSKAPLSPDRVNAAKASTSHEEDRMQILRRRPPPPPPTFIKQAPIHGDAGLQEDNTESTAHTRSNTVSTPPMNRVASIAPGVDPVASNSPVLIMEQSPTSNFRAASNSSTGMPRSRSRPLPIPPMLPTTSRSEVIAQSEDPVETAETSSLPLSEPSVSITSAPDRPSMPSSTDDIAAEEPPIRQATRESSLGITDLDLFASRLTDQGPNDGTNYDDLHLLAEFLGPAKSSGATAAEVEALSVGVVEVMRKRVVGKKENGKEIVKLLLNVMGVKVERCGVCLVQYKEGNMACVYPCLHVLHEDCARKLLRSTKQCPTCRVPIA